MPHHRRDPTLEPRLTAWLAEHPWSTPREIITGLGLRSTAYETVRSYLANLYLRELAEWKYASGTSTGARGGRVWRMT